MEGDDPAPLAAARQPRDRVVEHFGRAPWWREGRVVEDHRRLAHRRRRVAQLAHERVDLREAGLGDREMPQLARQSAKGRRVPWSGGAVQVEEAADVDVARLARIEARSEEHTSELQSLMRISYAVFCLKKKK